MAKFFFTVQLFRHFVLLLLIHSEAPRYSSQASTEQHRSSIKSESNPEDNTKLVSQIISQLRGVQYALASVRLDVRNSASRLEIEMKRQISAVREAVQQESRRNYKDDADRLMDFEARRDDDHYERLVNKVITHLTGINNGMDSIRVEVQNYTDELNAERTTEIEFVKSEMAAVKRSVIKMQQSTEEMRVHGLEALRNEIKNLILEKDAAAKKYITELQVTLSQLISKLNDSTLESAQMSGIILEQLDTTRANQDVQQSSLNQTLDELTILTTNIHNQTAQIHNLENITVAAAENSETNFGKIGQMNTSVSANFDAITNSIQNFEPKLKDLFLKYVKAVTKDAVITGLNDIQETFHIQHDVLQNVVRSKDCCSIQRSGYVTSRVYAIYPYRNDLSRKVKVYCDMSTNGGGWTVFQRRDDVMGPTVDFNQDWLAYETGFGNQSFTFWLGLPHIAALTENRKQSLRVDLTDWENESKYAEYDWFKVEGPSELYRMTISGYSGSAGDSLITAYSSYNSSGMAFSTKDRDNDLSSNNCARNYNGGWWFNERSHVNPNGIYKVGGEITQGENGVFWHDFKKTLFYSLKRIEMKIRPREYPQGCKV